MKPLLLVWGQRLVCDVGWVGLQAVLVALFLSAARFWMDDAVGGSAAGPDQQQNVFACRAGVDFTHELLCAGDGMAIDFEDDVAGRESRVFSRAGRANALD